MSDQIIQAVEQYPLGQQCNQQHKAPSESDDHAQGDEII